MHALWFAATLISLTLAPSSWAKDAKDSKESAAPAAEASGSKASAKEGSAKEGSEAAPAEAAAPAPSTGVFESSWKDATADEKAAFLEANPEIRLKVSEKWDKMTSKLRKAALAKHSLLAARPLKQKWAEATPEERVAFLGTVPEMKKRVKEEWDLLNAAQRLALVQKHPSVIRKALNHNWTEATPEEKIAFVESQGDLRRGLAAMWALAAGSANKEAAQATPEERTEFLDKASTIGDSARTRWQSLPPQTRAALVRKWAGWKLKPMMGAAEPSISAKKKVAKKPAKKRKKSDDDE